jgi:hypothetical protein
MRHKPFATLLFTVFLLALGSTAFASTTWYVNGVSGSDSNNCTSPSTACATIGHAISLASSGDTIMVAPATYTENLAIRISLKILGANATTTIVDGGGVDRVLDIPSASARVELSQLTVQDGEASPGGGISNNGTLTMSNLTVANNKACPGHEGVGGGISNNGVLAIRNSTVSGNSACGVRVDGILLPGAGGGISNGGMLTITNSTIAGNGATVRAGISNTRTVTINNSTISGNTGSYNIGGIGNFSGCSPTCVVALQNSIVANNAGGNCGGTMTSNGYNLSSDGTCNFTGPGDLNNTDPVLGLLQNNGGPTQTMSETVGSSPTIDAGNPNGCTDSQGHLLTTDQRGYPRPGEYKHDKRCDMGAYESQTD